MTPFRLKELEDMTNDAELTSPEMLEGWHFCYDWDGLLVNVKTNTSEECNCGFKKALDSGTLAKELNGI